MIAASAACTSHGLCRGVWSNDAFGDRGWLAIALVIFSIWRPNLAIIASILFGGLYIVYLYIPAGTQLYMMELYKMLPYLVTIIVLVVVSMRKKRENEPPAAARTCIFPRRTIVLKLRSLHRSVC